MLKSPFNFGKAKSLLVCETDGFIMRGAVFTRAGKEIVVLHKAQSQQANMADAVADLVKQLKEAGWEGKEAVLLSPTVLSTLVELPINPKKPRPLPQMQELVKWEVEPLLMQHTTQWSVGHLLVGRGYMTAEQAEAVLDLQQAKPNSAGGLVSSDKYALRRFGELAEELGYIRSSQLKACLAGQEWLKSDDEEIECGWLPQGEVPDVPGTYNWLVSCTNKSLLRRWIKTFNTQGIDLQAMYPLAGCSTSLLTQNISDAVLLESHADSALAQHIIDEKITAQFLLVNPAKQPVELCIESFHTLNSPSTDTSYLADWQINNQELVSELKNTLDITPTLLDQPPVSEGVSPGMAGASLHALMPSDSKRCTNVRLGGPLPLLWERVEVRAIALCLALFLIIAGTEVSLLVRDHQIQTKKAEIDSRWKVISAASSKINSKIKQVEARKALIKEQEKEQLRAQARLKFFSEEIPDRVALVQAVLGVLPTAVTDEIIITQIDELGKRVSVMPALPMKAKDTRVEVENFNIAAWALTESGAQTFIQNMKEALEPWGLEVRDSKVFSRLGPMKIEGFAVSMRLVKLVSADAIKEQQAIQ
jgi:hypothetical protein